MSRSSLLSLVLVVSLLPAAATPPTYKAVGRPVTAKELLAIYGHWFDRPYEYMFDRSNPVLTVGNQGYGVFLAGIDGIVLYGGITKAIAAHSQQPKRGFYNLRPIERLSGLKIHRQRASSERSFSRFNPAIVRWGHQNLIPDPQAGLLGQPCQKIYDRLFSRFFRLMVESRLYLQRKQSQRKEQAAYLKAMKRRRFDGIDYLQKRFSGALPNYDIDQDGTNFTPAMAIGFWIRRGIDGTADELWTGLTKLMQLYDGSWWQARMQQLPAERWPKRRPRKPPKRRQ
jgi:hypothetical protein